MKTKKKKYLLYTSKNAIKKHLDLLLLEEKDKNYCAIIKDFNTFMHNHTLHRGRKYFCCYWNNIWNKLKYLYFL